MIALIDYGIGNLRSVQNALEHIRAEVRLTEDPAVILAADKVVLPGVGAFGDGMKGLRERGLVEAVREVAARGAPLLGICVGMQVLFEVGEERGEHEGLGILPGRVRQFQISDFRISKSRRSVGIRSSCRKTAHCSRASRAAPMPTSIMATTAPPGPIIHLRRPITAAPILPSSGAAESMAFSSTRKRAKGWGCCC